MNNKYEKILEKQINNTDNTNNSVNHSSCYTPNDEPYPLCKGNGDDNIDTIYNININTTNNNTFYNDNIFIDTKKNANDTRYYVVKDGKDKGNIVCISHRKRIDHL